MADNAQTGWGEVTPIDVAVLIGAISLPLVWAPLVLALVGEYRTAAMVGTGSWLITMCYESRAVEAVKQEVFERD